MPDGKFALYEFHSPRVQAAYAASVRETEREQTRDADRAAWLRFREGLDMIREAIGDVEQRHPDAIKSWDVDPLDDLESTIRGVTGRAE